MAIIGSLPNNLSNGTTADASQVMADLNFITNQVNANAMPANVSSQVLTMAGLVLNEPGSADGTLVINAATDPNGAAIKLTGNGGTTPNKYIKVLTGNFLITNSADSVVLLNISDSGNVVANGTITGTNITGSSDERLKQDWEDLPDDFIERLASVQNGTFTRIDTGARNAGVSAQSLQSVLPEAVLEGSDGYLSVAYGNAALVAVIELAREVLRLRALLEPI